MKTKMFSTALTLLLLSACSSTTTNEVSTSQTTTETTTTETVTESTDNKKTESTTTAEISTVSGNLSDYFTDRDLEQNADASQMSTLALSDGNQTVISTAGVYEVSGNYSNSTIVVEAGDEDKVQIVLNNATITNSDFPCIYVKNADKVFVTSMGTNSLSVTGTFRADGDTNTDAVIFSRDDVVLNGTGSLTVSSTDNGISGKDDVKFTGGTYSITASADAVEANEVIAIADGTFSIQTGKDAFNAGDDDDLSTGEIVVFGGTFDIKASDDGFQATTNLKIEGGTMNISSAEGLEGTWVTINGGTINISASDDGINAAMKTNSGTPEITINGGDITINMGAGDTDGIDSNGNLTITGGTISVNGQSTIDVDGKITKTGGTVILNGTETETVTNSQMMGGPGMGGKGNRRSF